jgi:(p)ppGpp synthase/HD superfamily hydrolase
LEESVNRDDFFERIQDRPQVELETLQVAYWLAKDAHREQRRDSGERYFEHPRRVAIELVNLGFTDTRSLVAALTHDVIEDTDCPPFIYVRLLGAEAWRRCERLSKVIATHDPVTGGLLGKIKKPAETYFNELREDLICAPVKCADRLDNLKSCGANWEVERIARYVLETEERILPLADARASAFSVPLRTIIQTLKDTRLVVLKP